MSAAKSSAAGLGMLLKGLKLPTVASAYEEVAGKAEAGAWTYENYLAHLLELEAEQRRQGRIARHIKQSKLPSGKTLGTLDLKSLPAKVAKVLPSLCEGGFADRAENILAFGNPGTGKSHIACAIGHELIHRGKKVLFVATFRLVQQLLVAKRDLCFDAVMRRLDRFEVVILDDIGYVQQDRSEMEVLFTFLSERYERRSVIITSNLVFSQWDKIFKDPMTTAAAIDRVVHHSTILELTGKSFRTEAAKTRQKSRRNDEA